MIVIDTSNSYVVRGKNRKKGKAAGMKYVGRRVECESRSIVNSDKGCGAGGNITYL